LDSRDPLPDIELARIIRENGVGQLRPGHTIPAHLSMIPGNALCRPQRRLAAAEPGALVECVVTSRGGRLHETLQLFGRKALDG
jgi:hypothetical protein